ncbi:TonB-dependent receptor, partial [bacterium]|nr:TonB-dependent receptor [bacterium]
MRKHIVGLLLILLSFSLLSAEEIVITGTVIDSISHQGISIVNIFLKGTTVGTTTDESGSFIMIIDDPSTQTEIVFQHISYEVKSISIQDLKSQSKVILSKKTISLEKVRIKGKRELYDYKQDITNIISVIPARAFESKGFIDAADILVTDQSTLVDESLNGRKTVSIRGSNQDEVLVLYDGIRINNNFDNLFDFSLIDPSILEQIDIIKGSNIAAFGSFGSSAVINFVPKLEQDFLMRFHQRIGTYNSGDWGLNFFKDLYGFKIFSAIKQAGSTQRFVGSKEDGADIAHESSNKTLSLSYNFNERFSDLQKHLVRLNYLQSSRDYDNQKYSEKLSMSHEIRSVKYTGNYEKFGEASLLISNQAGDELHSWDNAYSSVVRQIKDNTLQVCAEHVIRSNSINFYVACQYEDSHLDFQDKKTDETQQTIGLGIYNFRRERNGYSSAIQFLNTPTSSPFDLSDINFSFSHEQVKDYQPLSLNPETMNIIDNKWRESSYMFSTSFIGTHDNHLINAYINYGVNFRIPTLYQQMVSKFYRINDDLEDELLMEYRENFEIGLTISNNQPEASSSQYQITSVIFHSSYRNKFRMIQLSGSPITFIDNHTDASILGFETTASTSLFQKKCTFNVSFSKYFIPEKPAFPFKSDKKITTGVSLNLMGFNLDFMWYKEAQRIGWVYVPSDDIKELVLPEFSNIDLHVKKSFEFWRCKCFGSFSGRNLL